MLSHKYYWKNRKTNKKKYNMAANKKTRASDKSVKNTKTIDNSNIFDRIK